MSRGRTLPGPGRSALILRTASDRAAGLGNRGEQHGFDVIGVPILKTVPQPTGQLHTVSPPNAVVP